MQKSLLVLFVCLCVAAYGQAKENTGKEMDFAARLLPRKPAAHGASRAAQLLGTNSARAAFAATSSFSLFAAADSAPGRTPFAAPPAPTPLPRRSFAYNLGNEPNWELGFGFSYMNFNGPSPLQGSLLGVNTSLSYFVNEWFAIEGVATSVFSSKTILTNERIQVGVYGGGIRMVYREQRWQPWGHFDMGLAHEEPLTGFGGRNTLAYVLGAGTDYRWNQLLSFRIQADLVGTNFFSQTQHHYQGTTGIVLHF